MFEEVEGFFVVVLPELFLFEDELLLLLLLDEPEVLLPEVEELDFLLVPELVFDELLLFDDEAAFLLSLASFTSLASTLTVFPSSVFTSTLPSSVLISLPFLSHWRRSG